MDVSVFDHTGNLPVFEKTLIDVKDLSHVILLNPKLKISLKEKLLRLQKHLSLKLKNENKGYVFLTSSGSNGSIKLVALSKEAMQVSAEAVNQHLEVEKNDVWVNPLPCFHVGGLAIYARALLSNSDVHQCNFSKEKWHPQEFVLEVSKANGTLTSLVPTQLYDLVLNQIVSPKSLRAVIIGGGAISEKLYFDALKLGWKILPSYGLTECSSQVATAKLKSWRDGNDGKFPELHPLSHVQIRQNEESCLMIKSHALLSGLMSLNEKDDDASIFLDPKVDGWLTTEDHVQIVDGKIMSISRNSDFIKIGGESVDMVRLEKIFEEEKISLGIDFDSCILSLPDERLGASIHLAMTNANENEKERLIESFKARVAPFEQIRKVHYVEKIPRSPLNKVLKNNLKELILSQ